MLLVLFVIACQPAAGERVGNISESGRVSCDPGFEYAPTQRPCEEDSAVVCTRTYPLFMPMLDIHVCMYVRIVFMVFHRLLVSNDQNIIIGHR